MIDWIVLALFILSVIFVRIKRRGYFWKDKQGNKVTAKEFCQRFKEGVQGITPLQQKRISLWSMLPLFGGLFWGIAVTFIAKIYWLCLLLSASLPITTIQLISTLQQYWSIKKVEEVMKDLK